MPVKRRLEALAGGADFPWLKFPAPRCFLAPLPSSKASAAAHRWAVEASLGGALSSALFEVPCFFWERISLALRIGEIPSFHFVDRDSQRLCTPDGGHAEASCLWLSCDVWSPGERAAIDVLDRVGHESRRACFSEIVGVQRT